LLFEALAYKSAANLCGPHNLPEQWNCSQGLSLMPRRSAHRLSVCFGKLQSLGTTWRDVQASVALLHGYLAVADDSKKSM
jgi:hypothetical protein